MVILFLSKTKNGLKSVQEITIAKILIMNLASYVMIRDNTTLVDHIM